MERLWAPWRMEYIHKGRAEECIFCKAIDGGRERYVLRQEELAFVIMNTYPYNNGHVMVAPKRHTGEIKDLSDDEMLAMFKLVEMVIGVIKDTMRPEAFNVGMNLGRLAGAGVEDHIHIHIVPRWLGDTNFMPVFFDTKVVSQSLKETYSILRRGFNKIKT